MDLEIPTNADPLVVEGKVSDDDWKKDSDCSTSVGAYGTCAICLEKIPFEEVALVKGCEHAYCVTCILVWATYKEKSCCPQCKNPFLSLNVHRSLDGSFHDYMFEESVCLLLRATWFIPLQVEASEGFCEDEDDFCPFEHDEEDDDDELDYSYYASSSSNIRIGNRRWGDNGYVRAGRKEARPAGRGHLKDSCGAGSSHGQHSKSKAVSENTKGRRAKRTMKREAAADMQCKSLHSLGLK